MPHYYKLYENDDELIKIASFFIKEGFDRGEYCFWATPDRFDEDYVIRSLRPYIELVNCYRDRGQFRAVKSSEWYIVEGRFDIESIFKKWESLYNEVISKGFTGLRAIGTADDVDMENWKVLMEYESKVDEAIRGRNVTALCVYNVNVLKSIVHISEVVNNHQDSYISD